MTRTRTVVLMLVAAIVAVGGLRPTAQETPAALEAAAKDAEQAGRLKEAFDLYVRAVQALPDPAPIEDDVRLRTEVNKLALRLQPRPVFPEDAERLAVRGQVLFRDAKDEDGFKRAESELRKAVRTAPWVPAFPYNLALVQEKLAHYKSAAGNLKVYLLSNPADADAVRAKMYEFELKREDPTVAALEDCDAGQIRQCRNFVEAIDLELTLDRPTTAADRQNARRAYELLLKACDTGRYPPACGTVGKVLADDSFTEGIGIANDPDGAERRLVQGCVAKDHLSCFNVYLPLNLDRVAYARKLGLKDWAREHERERDRRAELLKTLCSGGSAWACNFLGVAYEHGRVFKIDPKQAKAWYVKASALAGHGCDESVASDCSALAWLYGGEFIGNPLVGLGPDKGLAASLFQRACDLKVDDGGDACRFAAKLRR